MLISSDGAATLIAGAVQALATAGAIAGTVWQTNKTLKRAAEARREEADEAVKQKHRQASELTKILGRRLKIASEIMSRDRLSDRRVANLASLTFESHLAALERFRFEELSPKAMERFERVVGITQSARLEVEEFQESLDLDEKVLDQRERCAMRLNDYAEQVLSTHEKMVEALAG